MFWHLDEVFPWEFVIREVSSLTPPYHEAKAGRVVITIPKFRGVRGMELGQALVKTWNDAMEGKPVLSNMIETNETPDENGLTFTRE